MTSEFGAPAFGLGQVSLQQKRATAASCSQDFFGQCPISVIHIALGANKDPEYPALRSAISFWLWNWSRADDNLKARLRVAWEKIKFRLHQVNPTNLWSHVRGPISTLIASLER